MNVDAARAPIAGQKIAVIGAGLAGLTAARTLQQHGARVTVFDKGRGVGGRMATRRIDEYRFDHGAQFFTARSEGFLREVDTLQARGIVAPWPARWGRKDCDGLIAAVTQEPRFVGVNGMNSLPRALAEGLDIVLNAEVTDLSRRGEQWSLECSVKSETSGYDTVILAIPSPQAVALLTGISDFATEVAAATYAPCWAVMARFATTLPLAFDAISIDDGGPLRWVARNSGKPGFSSEEEGWTLHATPDWSLANIEESAEFVGDFLLGEFTQLFGITASPLHVVAHRWRYALVLASAGVPFFWDAALRIGACGDWCLGPRVEAAFDSGLALAQHLLGPAA